MPLPKGSSKGPPATPVWIEDVTTYHNFPRARGGVDIGIRAAFGVSVLVGPAVQAVLEFFRENPAPLDAHLLDLMGQIGTMLGRVIERERSKSALREANLRLEQTLQELQATQRQVVQQERLRALGQMASGVAHDFGNALMPIMGYSELLLGSKKLAGDASATLWLRTILTAATDAAAVVSRLRQFYRTHRTETDAPVNLRLLARQVMDLTHPVLVTQAQARGVHIGVDTDLPEVPPILGVESELRQAVINLVLNAIDAMPAGGTLLLKTRIAGDRVALDVRDTGIGMTAEEMRQRCLEPFFTTKTDGTASGLGLGIVYGVVQRHHGRLDIDSAVGQGTTITLRLAFLPWMCPRFLLRRNGRRLPRAFACWLSRTTRPRAGSWSNCFSPTVTRSSPPRTGPTPLGACTARRSMSSSPTA